MELSRSEEYQNAVAPLLKSVEIIEFCQSTGLFDMEIEEFRVSWLRLTERITTLEPLHTSKFYPSAREIAKIAIDPDIEISPTLGHHLALAFELEARGAASRLLPTGSDKDLDDLPELTINNHKELKGLIRKRLGYLRSIGLKSVWVDVIELRLLLLYLRRAWKQASPPSYVDTAVNLAQKLYRQHPNLPEVLSVVLDFWKVVGRRTFDETVFDNARKEGGIVGQRLGEIAENSIWYSVDHAEFYRAINDYDHAREILYARLSAETRPVRRYSMCSLWLDVVGHSINWRSKGDNKLLRDAGIAFDLYRSWLMYRGIPHEHWKKNDAAVRHILWLRCGTFSGQVRPDELEWVDRVYKDVDLYRLGHELTYSSETLGVLERLTDEPSEVAQVLGGGVVEPTRWREAGTFLFSQYGDTEYGRERAIKFWQIAKELFQREHYKNIDPNLRLPITSRRIADLNIAQGLLTYPIGSRDWTEGKKILENLTERPTMPWVYRRYARDLLNNL